VPVTTALAVWASNAWPLAAAPSAKAANPQQILQTVRPKRTPLNGLLQCTLARSTQNG